MPSFRQIRYFLRVAELGGFTPAAQALFIAQPALSRQIGELEKELGFPLFERHARGVKLTPAGALFRQRMAGLEQTLQQASEDGAQLHRGQAGVLRLLHSSSIPVRGLLPLLQQLHAEAPQARVELDRLASDNQIAEIAAGRADLGFVRLPVLRREPGLVLRPLPPERLWVALPPGHPWAERPSLAIRELEGQPLVTAMHRQRGGLARQVTELCELRGFTPQAGPVLSRKTSMLDLVAAGFGLAVIPEGLRPLLPATSPCLPLADDDALCHSALVHPLQPSPLALRFLAAAEAQWGSQEF